LRKAVFGSLFLVLLVLAIGPAGALGQAEDPQAPETVPAFLERLQSLLRNGDREGYLAFFAPEIRADETDRLATIFGQPRDDRDLPPQRRRPDPGPGGGPRLRPGLLRERTWRPSSNRGR